MIFLPTFSQAMSIRHTPPLNNPKLLFPSKLKSFSPSCLPPISVAYLRNVLLLLSPFSQAFFAILSLLPSPHPDNPNRRSLSSKAQGQPLSSLSLHTHHRQTTIDGRRNFFSGKVTVVVPNPSPFWDVERHRTMVTSLDLRRRQ